LYPRNSALIEGDGAAGKRSASDDSLVVDHEYNECRHRNEKRPKRDGVPYKDKAGKHGGSYSDNQTPVADQDKSPLQLLFRDSKPVAACRVFRERIHAVTE
jgi:hypothetical protein